MQYPEDPPPPGGVHLDVEVRAHLVDDALERGRELGVLVLQLLAPVHHPPALHRRLVLLHILREPRA